MTATSASLRTRVAAASALGALLVLAVSTVVLSVVLTRLQYRDLDRQVQALAGAVTPLLVRDVAAGRPGQVEQRLAGRVTGVLGSSYVAVARRDDVVLSDLSAAGAPVDLPVAPAGLTTVSTSAGDYRVLTAPLGRRLVGTVQAGLPVQPVRDRTAAIRRAVLVVGLLGVVAAAGLGLVLAGAAVRPLVVLRQRALAIGAARGRVRLDDVRGAREIEELAAAMGRMQDDLAAGRERESRSLAAARDFAAAAAHELRTPLAALSTDLAVLRRHADLPPADRSALLDSLGRAERRLTATLTALGQLARGDLADRATFEVLDLADLVPAAVADWRAAHPDVPVEVRVPPGEQPLAGWPAGLRLVLDNLLTNAVTHGGTSVVVSLVRTEGELALTVDDDGPGVPEPEREAVLARFARGTGAAPGGSGLGLALVAQQAALHGGSVRLLRAPTGGLRAEVRLPVTAARGPELIT